VAYEMQHNFFYAESLVHSRYDYKKIRYFGWYSEKVCALWADADRRIHNIGWLMRGSGDGDHSRRRQGGLGAKPSAFGDFYNFLMKITRC